MSSSMLYCSSTTTLAKAGLSRRAQSSQCITYQPPVSLPHTHTHAHTHTHTQGETLPWRNVYDYLSAQVLKQTQCLYNVCIFTPYFLMDRPQRGIEITHRH